MDLRWAIYLTGCVILVFGCASASLTVIKPLPAPEEKVTPSPQGSSEDSWAGSCRWGAGGGRVNKPGRSSAEIAAELLADIKARAPAVLDVIKRVRAERLTFADEVRLMELAQAVLDVEERGLNGELVETGCALGGSAIVIATAKKKNRPLRLYDVFGLIPAPRLRDGWTAVKLHIINRLGLRRGFGGDEYYGYQKNLLEKIINTLRAYGLDPEANAITTIKGRYDRTLSMPVGFDVALAHIDCDWYESVRTCLQAIEPKLVLGGRLVMDDYYDFRGCRDAVDAYFKGATPHEYSFVGRPQKRAMHIASG